jgi:hypothetical protein
MNRTTMDLADKSNPRRAGAEQQMDVVPRWIEGGEGLKPIASSFLLCHRENLNDAPPWFERHWYEPFVTFAPSRDNI